MNSQKLLEAIKTLEELDQIEDFRHEDKYCSYKDEPTGQRVRHHIEATLRYAWKHKTTTRATAFDYIKANKDFVDALKSAWEKAIKNQQGQSLKNFLANLEQYERDLEDK